MWLMPRVTGGCLREIDFYLFSVVHLGLLVELERAFRCIICTKIFDSGSFRVIGWTGTSISVHNLHKIFDSDPQLRCQCDDSFADCWLVDSSIFVLWNPSPLLLLLLLWWGLLGHSVYNNGNIDIQNVTISKQHNGNVTDLYLEGKNVTMSNISIVILYI
jgi:hypothetical protein